MALEKAYINLLEKQKLNTDESQLNLVRCLDGYIDYLDNRKINRFPKFFNNIANNKLPAHMGIYIWGEVGRGKSMLIDLFYQTLQTSRKFKQHFHEFMIEMHKKLEDLRTAHGSEDYITQLAKNIAKEYDVLCLDELQINNIADAMIVGRLFSELIKQQVLVFFTSNREPHELFKDGLQRERFEPFIDLIKAKLNVQRLNNFKDYRLEKLKTLKKTYFHPINKENDKAIKNILMDITGSKEFREQFVKVDENREIRVMHALGQVALFTFNELCALPMGAQDYLALCKQFSTLIITSIPGLDDLRNDEALRFITLIDCMYESCTKLICTAEMQPEEIYTKGKHAFEFKRTASRLIEMQSAEYCKFNFD